jgi:pseudouridine synthase
MTSKMKDARVPDHDDAEKASRGGRTLLRAVIEGSGLSRRKAFAAVREGRVSVAGRVVVEPSSAYEGGVLRLDGEVIEAGERAGVYLLLNKPPGYLSTVSDERGRPTVLDLVPAPEWAPGLHPVGRLDRDTSGLLLLTNDGDLTYALTHPKHEVEKEYWVRLARSPGDAVFAALREGVEIDGALRRPLRLRGLRDPQFQIAVTIREGRNRQVRRMFESIGERVVALRRMREGPVALGSLAEGAVRRLSGAEVEALRSEGVIRGGAA